MTDNIEAARNHFRQAAAILRKAQEDAAAQFRAARALLDTEETRAGITAFRDDTLDRPLSVAESLCLEAEQFVECHLWELIPLADSVDLAANITEAELEGDWIPDASQSKRRELRERWRAEQARERRSRADEVECALGDLLPALNRKIREAADREIGQLIAAARDGILSGRIKPLEARF